MKPLALFTIVVALAFTLFTGCGKYGRPKRVVHRPAPVAAPQSPSPASQAAVMPEPEEAETPPDS